jgi:transcriptional regulator GlxA family with amidase domain
VDDFDARIPEGADSVVVPALHRSDDPRVTTWVRSQAAKGATIVGVCSGVRTVSAAGLLGGRTATGHWYDIADLRKANPTSRFVRDRRYVVDRRVVTTTGVTASLPVSLALVEAIAGRERASALARDLGVDGWDARHDGSAFQLDRVSIRTAAGNWLAFWARETVAVPVAQGTDEIALAFTADAWSRTYRSSAVAVADHPGSVAMRWGLRLLPDRVARDDAAALTLAPPSGYTSARALDVALGQIRERYRAPTASFVALQLEYPQWER